MLGASMELPRFAQLVTVNTTSGRGFTPEELAAKCADKIVSVSEDAPAPIRDQAQAFKRRVEQVVLLYLKQAVHSDRTTVYSALNDAGHPGLADLVRRL
jgi:phage/plasmid primase-like uncharacterized protein